MFKGHFLFMIAMNFMTSISAPFEACRWISDQKRKYIIACFISPALTHIILFFQDSDVCFSRF
jgi:hypothetical protein